MAYKIPDMRCTMKFGVGIVLQPTQTHLGIIGKAEAMFATMAAQPITPKIDAAVAKALEGISELMALMDIPEGSTTDDDELEGADAGGSLPSPDGEPGEELPADEVETAGQGPEEYDDDAVAEDEPGDEVVDEDLGGLEEFDDVPEDGDTVEGDPEIDGSLDLQDDEPAQEPEPEPAKPAPAKKSAAAKAEPAKAPASAQAPAPAANANSALAERRRRLQEAKDKAAAGKK